MTEATTSATATPNPPPISWTCPFCPLLCDDLQPDPAALSLADGRCALAQAGLGSFAGVTARPRVRGADVSLDEAIGAARAWLAAARQPLLAGLGGDVAAARAVFGHAISLGAICDAAGGDALVQGLRAQQDRGGFNLTLAEVRARADLILFVGSWPLPRAPRLLERFFAARDELPALVALGAGVAPGVESVQPDAPLPDSLAMLSALVAGRRPLRPDEALQGLAERLRGARYAVLVWEPGALGPHAALIIEQIQRIVSSLNRSTRAAGFPLGGGHGAATMNQVFTWMSGLPLRTRAAAAGLRHDPVRFDAARVLARGLADALMWVNPFPGPRPLQSDVPRVVLGPGATAELLGDEANTVFIPVATPGVHTAGHLFRTDGVVLMPLFALRDDRLPTVAEVLERLGAAESAR